MAKEMSWSDFENLMAKILQKHGGGHWSLVIPKNKRGAQPFDLIAIGKNSIYAADCKVCSQPRFPLQRVEDNQWLAMEQLKKNSHDGWIIGFFCLYDGDIYIIPYDEAVYARKTGQKSIRLAPSAYGTSRARAYMFLTKQEIGKFIHEE